MANITNTLGFVTNPQFSGGEAITPLSGAAFAYANRGYGGIYVGTPGTLVVKTINGNVLTLVSASGFIPGLIGAVSASSTAANIIGFDPQPVAPPTTTTSTSTTVAPTTTTSTSTTAAPISKTILLYSGSYTGTPGSAGITGPGTVCYYSAGGGYPGPVSRSLYVPTNTVWTNAGSASIQAYYDAALTQLYTGSAGGNNLEAWGLSGQFAIRWFDTGSNAWVYPQSC